MIIKQSDNREYDLNELNRLLNLPHISTDTKRKIQQEIIKIQFGLKSEKEAAYNIDFYYGDSKRWMIIHDLRLEYKGQVAQIDHLILNRFMEIYVCESKHFSEGIAINEHGEFSAYYQGKAYGISSPIEQNNRHIEVLNKIFKAEKVDLPVRLGVSMKPKLLSLILVGNNAMIRRPKNGKNVDDLDRIIKNEQVFKRINKDIDEDYNPLSLVSSMAKVISVETLREFAENLAALHTPIQTDWQARFGISDTVTQPENPPPSPIQAAETPQTETPKRYFCAACQKTVTEKVAKYCWQHKTRFHGKVYCYDCQRKI